MEMILRKLTFAPYAKSAQPNKLFAMLEELQIPLEGELYRLQHYTST